jgi:phosphatidylserine decarboxylase
MIRLAPEGRPFVLTALLVAALLAAAQLWVPLAIWFPVGAWVVAFFRDPPRPGPRGEHLILAPADGKVVSVIPMEESDFLHGQSIRVSIFMNAFNVHVNRYPSGGVIRLRRHTPGRFGHAAGDKASLDNEQCALGLETARGRLLIRQIAGLLARRIVTDHAEGTTVRQADRLGMIRFGSRVDLFIPPAVRVMVRNGDATRAGVTVIGEWT